MRLNILTKILLLTLGLALPPLLLVGWLGLASLEDARAIAVAKSRDALRNQVRATLGHRALDKARGYDSTFAAVAQQLAMVARQGEGMLARGRMDGPSVRVWQAPLGTTSPNQDQSRTAVGYARLLAPLISAAVDTIPLVDQGYVAFEDGGVMAFSDVTVITTLQQHIPFDPREHAWYRAAREAQATIWTDAYVDVKTGRLVTTCATPLYAEKGAFLGVIGFDLPLDRIQDELLLVGNNTSERAFLITATGDVLASPDLTAAPPGQVKPFPVDKLFVSPDADVQRVVQRMLRREAGVEDVQQSTTHLLVAFAPIPTAGWSVALVIPEDDLVRPPVIAIQAAIERGQVQLSRQLLVLLISMAGLICVLGVLLALSLSRRLRAVQQGARLVASGQLGHQLPPAGHDEIGQLVASFNAMTHALREKVTELEEHARQLARLNAISNQFRSILDVPSLYKAIPQAVCEHFGFDRAVLYLVDGEELKVAAASFGAGHEERAKRFRAAVNEIALRFDRSISEADIVQSGQPVIVRDPWNHPRLDRSSQATASNQSFAQVPIFGNDKRVIGVISADHFLAPQGATVQDANQLLMFATMVGLTIENVRLYGNLERQVAQRTAELRDALERVRLADQRKSHFLASISHELRTPLNVIIGFSTVLLDDIDGPLSAAQREDVESIHRNGCALLKLINELLDLARIEAGRLEIERGPLNIHTLVQEVIETSQALVHQRQVALRAMVSPDVPLAYADLNRVRQILLNLLSNAIKFTEHGAIVVSAHGVADAAGGIHTYYDGQPPPLPRRPEPIYPPEVCADAVAPFIAISVRDTGIGIAAEQQVAIFEEFSQGHGQRSRAGGTGLGLAIVRRLVEAHGGCIWLHSVPGQGSTFTFTLPTIGSVQDQLYYDELGQTYD